MNAGAWIYRVFLLPSTLQVDLAFVAASEFRPLAPTFRLVSGRAKEAGQFPPPSIDGLIGMGWLYALHARSCIARGKLWQAEYMISGIRDNALALACLRRGLAAVHARGVDQLPNEVTSSFENALVRHLDSIELSRTFRAATGCLLTEIVNVDEQLGGRLRETLTQLIS